MFNDKYGLTAAVLEGRKTMTRRAIGPSLLDKIESFQDEYYAASLDWLEGQDLLEAYFVNHPEKLPYRVGDVVAVAQSYRDICAECFELSTYVVLISRLCGLAGWSNKMFTSSDEMPHQIRITGVRVERLQDISDEDCMEEGVHYIDDLGVYYFEQKDREKRFYFDTPREAYASLIDKVSGRGTWLDNPWVFVYAFELVQ